MNYITAFIFGYLLGSIPTAYLFLKRLKQIDITQTGSQNVGALNSYEVSESKLIGISVLLIDALKGFLTVYFLKEIFPGEFIIPAIGLTAAVFAHCFSPWIKFKGGRGLATGAGGLLYLSPVVFISWVVLWVVTFVFKKNVHVGNLIATILSLALVITTSKVFMKYSLPPTSNEIEFIIPISIMLIIILIKHWKPLLEWIGTQKVKKRNLENE